MNAFVISQKDRANTDDALMGTFTRNAEYYVTIEDREKMKQAIRDKVFDRAYDDFHIDESRNVSQESNFIRRYMKNDKLRGVFGVYRRCYRNGKPAAFEQAVLDEDGNCRWLPIKGQDALFSGADRE